MTDPEEFEPKPEFEKKIRSAYQVQDPDPLFIEHLQKQLSERFKKIEQSNESKDIFSKRPFWQNKGKLLFSPLAWGVIGIIFILFLVWGIRTLIPKVGPSISSQSTPSPMVSPIPSMEPTLGGDAEGVINLPTLIGMPVPLPEEAISAVNASQVIQLARWGRDPINAVSWAPDGNSFAVATGSNIHIYDRATFQEITTIVHGSSAYQLAYSPDGTKLAVGSYDSPVKIYDVSSGNALQTLEGNQITTGLAYSPEGVIVGSGVYDREGTITLWDAASGKELRTLCESAGLYYAFSPDWSILATVNGNRIITLWDVASGEKLRTLAGHSEDIYGITFSRDGSKLASWQSGMEMIINLWEVATGNLQNTVNVGETIFTVAFLPDGNTLATKPGAKPITLYDIGSGQVVRTIGDETPGGDIVLSSDGKVILYHGWQGDVIKLYDIASGEESGKLDLQVYISTSLAFSPDGSMVAAGLESGPIKLLDAANGQELRTLTGHTKGVNSLDFSPDGGRLASGSADTTNMLWDVSTGEQLNSMEGVQEFGWGTGAVPSVDFSPDGKLLAFAGPGGQVKVWDTANQTELRTLGGQAGGTATDAIAGVKFSPDGKILASGYVVPTWGYPSHLITLWDPTNGQELRSLQYSNNQQLNVSSLEFSPDGRMLAAGYWETKITMWDVESGNELYTLLFPWQDEISSLAFSPSGDVLAVGCGNGSIVLLDAASGQEIATLPGSAYTLAFSPDGKLLITSSYDGYIRLWGIIPPNAVLSEAAPTPAAVEIESIKAETQVAPEDIGMEIIPIPVLLSGEGLQSWWWSPSGSYFPYSQQGPIGEPGPDQAITTLYFLEAGTGQICQGIQETATFTQTEWGPSPEGIGLFDRTTWLDDNHLLYISPDGKLHSITPCGDSSDDWSVSLPDAIISLRDYPEEGSQILLKGKQAYWLFTPSTRESVKLDLPAPEEGKEISLAWSEWDPKLISSRLEERQGSLWIVLESIDTATGSTSPITEIQASPEMQNGYPMWASIDRTSEDQISFEDSFNQTWLYDLSSQTIQLTNPYSDLFGIENLDEFQVSAYGAMCGTGKPDSHLMLETGMAEDGQYYIYHPDTGAVDQYPLDPPLLVVYPCGEGGIAKPMMEALPSNNTYRVILVDSGTEPYDLVAKGHVPSQNSWSFTTILPGGQKVMFSSVAGISLVDLKSGETLNFWGLDNQVEYQDLNATLSPDGKTVVGFASKKGEAPGEGSSIQDIYWLRLEP